MKVCILGSGPAGLMAAYACERNDLEPVIFSSGEQSQVNEDMFLQRALPDLPGREQPDATIEYIQMGSSALYAEKCYGSRNAEISWHNIKWGMGELWWLREVYDMLWERYVGGVYAKEVYPSDLYDLTSNYSLVISTIPANFLCGDPSHRFDSVPTWLVRAAHRGDPARTFNTMVYNGKSDAGWFRMSRLRGLHAWEYPKEPREHWPEEISGTATISKGQKFTGNDCSCHPKVHRVGRWAMWQRGVLNHHAFEQTTGILASTGLGKGA